MPETGEHHDEHAGKKPHKKHAAHGGHSGGGHEEAHEGAPEWLISFADNVALLMGFFVILLAMNLKEPTTGGIGGKEQHGVPITSPAMLDFIISLREAFNNPVNLGSTDPNDAPLIRRIIQRREGTAIEDGPRGDRHNVEAVRPTAYYRTGGLVTFEEESTTIDEPGREAIGAVAKQLKGRRTIVEVRGHTSLAEAVGPLDRGMRLSFDRALGVAQLLRDGGLEWDQLRIVAVGPGDRVEGIARTPGEQRNNQRVEIVLTDENMPDDPFAMDPASGARTGAPK